MPVGWHEVDGVATVFTPALWRANFAEGHPVTVHHRGQRLHLTGTLETDPGRIAAALQSLSDPPRMRSSPAPLPKVAEAEVEVWKRRPSADVPRCSGGPAAQSAKQETSRRRGGIIAA